MGGDVYLVSRQGALISSGATLKVEALTEANQYCSARSKSLEVIRATDQIRRTELGAFPFAEVQFKCK